MQDEILSPLNNREDDTCLLRIKFRKKPSQILHKTIPVGRKNGITIMEALQKVKTKIRHVAALLSGGGCGLQI